MDRESYRRGQEDAVELCLYELSKARNLEDAKRRIQEILGLIKEDKIVRLRDMLERAGLFS